MADADVLNMSLDDIIAKNKTQQGPRRGENGAGARGRGRRMAQRSSRPGGPAEEGVSPTDIKITVQGGGVRKPVGNRRPRGGRSGAVLTVRNVGGGGGADLWEAEDRPSADILDGPGKWRHDKFDASQPLRRPSQQRQHEDGFKLHISNLAYNVSDDDIKELFETCGPIKRFGVHYDRSGRSKGTADVVFVNRGDALKALKQFNTLALDNQPMQIELVESPGVAGLPGSRLKSGISVSRGGAAPQRAVRGGNLFSRTFDELRGAGGGGGGGPRGGSRLGRGRGGGGRSARSAADLDAELDDYMAE